MQANAMERMALISPLGFGTPSSMASRFELIKGVIMMDNEGKLNKHRSRDRPRSQMREERLICFSEPSVWGAWGPTTCMDSSSRGHISEFVTTDIWTDCISHHLQAAEISPCIGEQ